MSTYIQLSKEQIDNIKSYVESLPYRELILDFSLATGYEVADDVTFKRECGFWNPDLECSDREFDEYKKMGRVNENGDILYYWTDLDMMEMLEDHLCTMLFNQINYKVCS